MKIGMITQWYEPELGPARLPGSLARKLVDRGHEVHVLTGYPNYPSGKIMSGYRQKWSFVEQISGVNVHRVPLFPSHSSSVTGRVANYASFAISARAKSLNILGDCDALWVSNSPTTVALPMWKLISKTGAPTLLHILDLWPDNVQSSGFLESPRAEQLAVSAINRWNTKLYGSASHIACISPGVLEALVERGVERDKLSFVPMWATNEEEIGNYRRLREDSVSDRDGVEIRVLYAGNIGSTQTVDALVRAADYYPADAPPIRIDIVGSGTEENRVKDLAATRNRSNFEISFYGRVSDTELATFMSHGDIHYVGLRDDRNSHLSIPSKVQSTLAWGKPLLVSMKGDTSTFISSGRAGIVAKPEDPSSIAEALVEVSRLGRAGLAALGNNSRILYEQEFSLDAAANKLESVLESIVRATSR